MDIEDLKPHCPCYNATNLRLEQGQTYKWCTCGLSKLWCTGDCEGTDFKPLEWTVPHQQRLYQICQCKYTSKPPYCDGTHASLPLVVKRRQESCQEKHLGKLCSKCGFVNPDLLHRDHQLSPASGR